MSGRVGVSIFALYKGQRFRDGTLVPEQIKTYFLLGISLSENFPWQYIYIYIIFNILIRVIISSHCKFKSA